MIDLTNRHPSTQQIAAHFDFEHLPSHLRAYSEQTHHLAQTMIQHLPDGPELAAGLRKLLEAKDCFVRAANEAFKKFEPAPTPSREEGWYSDAAGVVRHYHPQAGWTDSSGAGVSLVGVAGPFRPAEAPTDAPTSTPAP